MRALERALPSLSYVVARSRHSHVIGCDNQLPWKLASDLKHFRKTTTNHVVIMGRKTLESIGHALPKRVNIVLSKEKIETFGPDIIWASTLDDALFLADHYSIVMGQDEIFVIGGERIYTLFWELFNKIHLTEVDSPSIIGDSYFDYKFNHVQWEVVERRHFDKNEVDEYPFCITIMERRRKYVRMIDLRDFYIECDEFNQWKNDQSILISPRPRRIIGEQFKLNLVG